MWQLDGPPMADAGDIGGDNQIGRAFSARFVNLDLRGRIITVYAYPIGEGDRVTAVESATEYLICRDPENPGGTEEWSDYRYQHLEMDMSVISSIEQAEWAAESWIRLRYGADFDWNGERF